MDINNIQEFMEENHPEMNEKLAENMNILQQSVQMNDKTVFSSQVMKAFNSDLGATSKSDVYSIMFSTEVSFKDMIDELSDSGVDNPLIDAMGDILHSHDDLLNDLKVYESYGFTGGTEKVIVTHLRDSEVINAMSFDNINTA